MKKSEAVKKAGSAYRLAALLKISRQAVSKWPGDRMPPARVAQARELWQKEKHEKTN